MKIRNYKEMNKEMNKGKTMQQDAEKNMQIMISEREAAEKKIKDLNTKEPTKMFYLLAWNRIGELSIRKGVCNRCNKETNVASFGEGEYGHGSICKKCISALFSNFEY